MWKTQRGGKRRGKAGAMVMVERIPMGQGLGVLPSQISHQFRTCLSGPLFLASAVTCNSYSDSPVGNEELPNREMEHQQHFRGDPELAGEVKPYERIQQLLYTDCQSRRQFGERPDVSVPVKRRTTLGQF